MRKLLLSGLIWLLLAPVCLASPLQDFTKEKTSIYAAWRPNEELRKTSVGMTDANWEFSVTHALDKTWAIGYRQAGYDAWDLSKERANNYEVNAIYKLSDTLQLYAGVNRTNVNRSGVRNQRDVAQIGIIGFRQLSEKLKLYTNIGGGIDVTNIEFGLSYSLAPNLELDGTYRHLTAEKIGPGRVKANWRGFGLGITNKF